MTQTSAFDDEVRLSLYRLFVGKGRAPVAAEIAADLETSSVDVEAALNRLHDSHVVVLAPGTPYVWMANPLSALPTPYRATVDGTSFWGNCVWDAFGVVAMLGGTGRVDARCGHCSDELIVDVSDRTVADSDYVVHYAVPAAHWWDDIGFN